MCFLESMFLFWPLKNVPRSFVEVCTIETKHANKKRQVAKIAPVLFTVFLLCLAASGQEISSQSTLLLPMFNTLVCCYVFVHGF